MSTRQRLDQRLRRIGATQLRQAVGYLRDPIPDDARIHQARKAIKRLRALARLLASAVGRKRARKLDHAWRDVARELGPAREARVRIDTVLHLQGRLPVGAPGELDGRRIHELLLRLEDSRYRALRELAENDRLPDLAARLKGTIDRFLAWPLPRDPKALLRPGLHRSHELGRRAYRRLGTAPTGDAVHEWRKAVKDLWYQTHWIEPAWPAGIKPLVATLDAVAARLGEHHDCDDFERVVLQVMTGDELEAARGTLARALDDRRAELLEAARRDARLVYHERSGPFARRLTGYAKTCWGAG